jgi:hypothetical protein
VRALNCFPCSWAAALMVGVRLLDALLVSQVILGFSPTLCIDKFIDAESWNTFFTSCVKQDVKMYSILLQGNICGRGFLHIVQTWRGFLSGRILYHQILDFQLEKSWEEVRLDVGKEIS